MKSSSRKSWAVNLLLRTYLTLDPSYNVKRGQESDIVRFDFGPLLKAQTQTAKLKVLITHLLLVLEVCNVKPTYRKSWAGNHLMSDLTLGPSFKVHWLW